jgi:hypothetical protein
MEQDLAEKKEELKEKLERLQEEYPNTDPYNLDKWGGEGFPDKIRATFCGLPEVEAKEGSDRDDYGGECTYCHLDPVSFGERNEVLKEKYGFDIDYHDGNLYYNADLRSIAGFVLEEQGDCVEFLVETGKYGVSPVGYQAEKVENIVEDAVSLSAGRETGF